MNQHSLINRFYANNDPNWPFTVPKLDIYCMLGESITKLILMKKYALILMILCTHAIAENKTGIDIKKSYEIIQTVMRIRTKYPPTHAGTLKLWDDYLNFKN